MSSLILRLSNEPVITLPADLAQRAGLEEGMDLQATVMDREIDLRPADQETRDYAAAWPARRAQLRERAMLLGLYGPDQRDDEYWQIVTPLLEELDHEMYF